MFIFADIRIMYSKKIISLVRNINIIYIVIAVLTVIIALLNPLLFNLLNRTEIIGRIIASVGIIAPLAFLMGIPFPYGMSKITDNSRYLVAYSWGINGFFSVLGSILVVMLSMSFGFRVVFIVVAV